MRVQRRVPEYGEELPAHAGQEGSHRDHPDGGGAGEEQQGQRHRQRHERADEDRALHAKPQGDQAPAHQAAAERAGDPPPVGRPPEQPLGDHRADDREARLEGGQQHRELEHDRPEPAMGGELAPALTQIEDQAGRCGTHLRSRAQGRNQGGTDAEGGRVHRHRPAGAHRRHQHASGGRSQRDRSAPRQ